MISRYLCQILYAIKKCNLLSDRCYLTTFLNGFVLRSSLQVLAVSQLKYEQFNLHKVSAVGGLVCGTVGFLGFFWCDWTDVSKCFGAVEPAGLFCVKRFATMQSPLQKQKKHCLVHRAHTDTVSATRAHLPGHFQTILCCRLWQLVQSSRRKANSSAQFCYLNNPSAHSC